MNDGCIKKGSKINARKTKVMMFEKCDNITECKILVIEIKVGWVNKQQKDQDQLNSSAISEENLWSDSHRLG